METKIATFAVVALFVAVSSAFPQGPLNLPKPGANGQYAPDHYFQYANVPAPGVFEWGYKRGSEPEHFREEYLSQNGHTFKAKLRWGDAYGGAGEQFYDFNHVNKEPAYKEPAYSPPSYNPPPPKPYA